MTSVAQRDDAALIAGLTGWLSERNGGATVTLSEAVRPSAGYSSDTVLVDATWSVGGTTRCDRLVIRMGPVGPGTFHHYDLVPQLQAQLAAATVGVPVPDPVVETDTGWIGTPFMVMKRIDGHIVGALAHRDRWLGELDLDDRGRVFASFVSTIARIHTADPGSAPDVPRRDNLAELEFWEDYLNWSSGGSPVVKLSEALAWCRDNRPSREPPAALLWGDVRFENAIIGDDLAVRAILDWDMTSVGAPEHDLAWFTGLALTMEHIFGERLDGFRDRLGTVALFEEHWGRAVQDLEWYETLAMMKSTAVLTRISYLRRDAGEPAMMPIDDNPMLDLLMDRIR